MNVATEFGIALAWASGGFVLGTACIWLWKRGWRVYVVRGVLIHPESDEDFEMIYRLRPGSSSAGQTGKRR
jgi:hypothetical protein